jgi:hypothetical protein
MEDTLTAVGSFIELKGKLKIKFPSLTEADLNYEINKREEMLNDLRIKLGKTREEWSAIMAIL